MLFTGNSGIFIIFVARKRNKFMEEIRIDCDRQSKEELALAKEQAGNPARVIRKI